MTITATPALDAISTEARRNAVNVRDPYHRLALAETFRQVGLLLQAVGDGLDAGAPEGLQPSTHVASNLTMAAQILDDLTRWTAAGDLWQTHEAVQAAVDAREALYADFAANPYRVATDEDLALERSVGYNAALLDVLDSDWPAASVR